MTTIKIVFALLDSLFDDGPLDQLRVDVRSTAGPPSNSQDYFAFEHLKKMSTEAFKQVQPKVLVHEEPYASNVFVESDSKEARISVIID
ncbi:hypothetical protein KIN20_001607 [Parelaphostrongylus tenuis]|uniref:Uncharacterized protein n=1 Tax=Parelaphostrongylus tenuis TaxID=148309 RepID=A0AAD5LX77_PARTN|nr:hypothetical protein KIN20_001607 [Parelaphostrongylus tenuis]